MRPSVTERVKVGSTERWACPLSPQNTALPRNRVPQQPPISLPQPLQHTAAGASFTEHRSGHGPSEFGSFFRRVDHSHLNQPKTQWLAQNLPQPAISKCLLSELY